MWVDLTQLWELVKQFLKTIASASGVGLKSARQAVRKKKYSRRNQNQSQSLMASNLDGVGVLQEKVNTSHGRAQHAPGWGVRAAEGLELRRSQEAAGPSQPLLTR